MLWWVMVLLYALGLVLLLMFVWELAGTILGRKE